MKFGRTTLLALGLSVCALSRAAALSPLHTEGTRIVDSSGKTVILRGINLGSWLVMETYFLMGPGDKFKDERSLWDGVEKRFGKQKMEDIRDAFRSAWITEEDFHRIHSMGLNSVRVPFQYRLLKDDVKSGGEDGWKWLDRTVDWCGKAGLYCILDQHGAAGGQSKEDHTGDSGRNALWGDPEMQRKTSELWSEVARRYRGAPQIAAFDLLNEPMGAPDNDSMIGVQEQFMKAVRSADPDRLVIMEEAYRGLETFPVPAQRGWTGILFSEHQYPTMGMTQPKPEVHEKFIAEHYPELEKQQKRLGAPIYIGEWNVIDESSGGGAMARHYISEMESRGWSWAIWTYKQTVRKPDAIVFGDWSFYHNEKPINIDWEKDDADTILAKIQSLRTENLQPFSPMIDAVRPPQADAQPIRRLQFGELRDLLRAGTVAF